MDRYAVPKKLPFSRKSLSAKVVISYISDYVIIIVLIVAFFALDAVEPFHQPFSLKDYTLMYPFAVHERVPIPLLLAVCVVAPAIIIAVYTLVIDGIFSHHEGGRKTYSFKKRLWELNCGILGLLLAVGASFVITGTLKNAIGKPRPDLIDRCMADPQVMALFLMDGNFTLASHAICKNENNAILKDGFRSFPSGHSSSSFAGLFYLSLYLTGKMHVLDSRGEVWKTFIVLIPSLGAALVAGSRIMDARHHPFDVLSGSLLGILVAWAAYRQYFPPLHDFKAKGRAYPIRTWGRISEDPSPYSQDAYNDRVPLRQEENPSRQAYSSGRNSPAERTGNVFQEEIRASQRRRQEGAVPYAGLERSQTDTPSPAIPPVPTSIYTSHRPGTNPFTTSDSSRQFRRDDWNDSSDDESTDVELRPTYTLSKPSGPGSYDPSTAAFETQDTSYGSGSAGMPPTQLLSSRAVESSDGDVAATPTSPPLPPPHGQAQGSPRGVQLMESYTPR